MAKKTKSAAKKSVSATTKKSAAQRATAAKKATRSKSASAAKKKSKKMEKPKAPFITTEQGAKALQYYCEGIMDMVGEYILIRNPKISQKSFTTEAHAMIRGIFGMSEKRAAR